MLVRPKLKPGAPLDRAAIEGLLTTRGEHEELDLRGFDLSGADLTGLELRLVNFGDRSSEPAAMTAVRFTQARLSDCRLAEADLTRAYFRGAIVERTDFRYARFSSTQLSDATFRSCDFYRAQFLDGTLMDNVTLEEVSLGNIVTDGALGLAWSAFDHGRPALIGEAGAERYAEFLWRTASERPTHDSLERAVANRLDQASRVYRALSAYWATQGRFSDAGRAYVRSRRLERQDASVLLGGRPDRVARWAGSWLADLTSGYGESLARVALSVMVLALGPGVAYAIFGGVDGARDPGDAFLFSISQLTTSTPPRLSPANTAVEWIGVVQTLVGIALLGLFGFVLGNKIRNT